MGASHIPLNWEMPSSLEPLPSETVIQYVNNDKIRVITTLGLIQQQTDSGLPSTTLYAYSKESKEWSHFTLSGNALKVRGFGKWVASEETFVGSTATISPSEYDSQSTYMSIERRSKLLNVTTTGTFYLFDTESKSLIQHETQNPDSEVLFVENDQVYFRIADEIWIASIQGDLLVDQELVIKSDEILNVHWMTTTSPLI